MALSPPPLWEHPTLRGFSLEHTWPSHMLTNVTFPSLRIGEDGGAFTGWVGEQPSASLCIRLWLWLDGKEGDQKGNLREGPRIFHTIAVQKS